MQKEKLKKLTDAFSWGCSDAEACDYAGISVEDLGKYLTKNPEFGEQKNKLRNLPIVLLKKRLFEGIGDAKPETCLKILEKQINKNTSEVKFEEILALEKILKKS